MHLRCHVLRSTWSERLLCAVHPYTRALPCSCRSDGVMPAVPPDEATSRRIWHDEVRTLAAQHLEMDSSSSSLLSATRPYIHSGSKSKEEKQTDDDATWASKTCSSVQLRPASQPAMVSLWSIDPDLRSTSIHAYSVHHSWEVQWFPTIILQRLEPIPLCC